MVELQTNITGFEDEVWRLQMKIRSNDEQITDMGRQLDVS